jgi:hypothetical protein
LNKLHDRVDPDKSILPAAPAEPAPLDPAPRRRWRRRLWVLTALVVVGIGGWLFRESLLRLLADGLIAEEPLRKTQCALVLERSCPLDEIASLYREGMVAEVVLFQHPLGRADAMGIVPPKIEALQHALAERGIPRERMAVLDSQPGTGWDYLRIVRTWLESRPDVEVTAFVDRFDSRAWQHRLHGVLPPSLWPRIHLHTFAPRAYNESNWWRSKLGVVALFNGYLRFLHVVGHGEETATAPAWDPDAYIRGLRKE